MGKEEKRGKSARRGVQAEAEVDEELQQRKTASQTEVLNVDDDDDTEANEDLSLKIVEKAMLRKSNGGSSSKADTENFIVLDDVVMNFVDDKSKKKESKKKERKRIEAELKSSSSGHVSSDKDGKFENFCSDMFLVDAVKEEEKSENVELVDEAVKTNPIEALDNTVFRKLLRGPRYFDPPDSSWGTCYNCGEEGHMAVNCTSAKRRKPCFVCGSLEHMGRQCPNGQECYICRKAGHRAKDCLEKSRKGVQNSKICLKCGDSGHEMFSCSNDYDPDDLKEIKCYVCGSIGHLCCVNYTGVSLREITCYRCGRSGHTGLECSASQKKMVNMRSDGSCFRCGEQGHFARECTNASQGGKKISESRTPKRRIFKENQDYTEAKSAPHDLGKTRKGKKPKYEKGFSSASKPKGKYGWTTEDPGDFTSSKGKATSWRSPATPNHKRFRTPEYSNYGHASTSYSPWESRGLHYNGSASNGTAAFNHPRYASWDSDHSASYGSGTHHNNRFASQNYSRSTSNGSADYYQPRFESRFDNSSSFGRRKNYD